MGSSSKKQSTSVSPFAQTSFSGGTQAQASTQNEQLSSLSNLLTNFSNWFQQQQSQQQIQQQAQQQAASQQQKQTAASPYAAPLAASGMTEIGAGGPLEQTSAAQMLEALRTGGINAFIPWISRAVDAVRQGGSQGVQDLRQQLATGGFGNTLAGQTQLAQARQQAGQATASTPAQIIQSWITQAPAYGAQLTGGGQQALGAAMPGAMTTTGTGTTTGTQTGTQTGAETGTTGGTSGGTQTTTEQQLQNVLTQLNALMQSNLYSTARGVGVNQTSGTSTPSFWDQFTSGLSAAGDAASGFGAPGA